MKKKEAEEELEKAKVKEDEEVSFGSHPGSERFWVTRNTCGGFDNKPNDLHFEILWSCDAAPSHPSVLVDPRIIDETFPMCL